MATPSSSTGPSKPTPYKTDYAYAAEQQAGKHFGKVDRFILELPTNPPLAFQAHIDPQDLVHSAEKRVAQLDTLTGVVIQDFGYKPETIELRGTTGIAYFKELESMQEIFKNQNIKTPTPVKLTVETRTYLCLWQGFSFQRTINANSGNIYMYTMSFTVLQTGGDRPARRQATQSQGLSSTSPSPSVVTKNITIPGQSVDDYLKTVPEITPSNKSAAHIILAHLWSNVPNNGSFPRTDTKLTATQTLVVPVDWASALVNIKSILGIG